MLTPTCFHALGCWIFLMTKALCWLAHNPGPCHDLRRCRDWPTQPRQCLYCRDGGWLGTPVGFLLISDWHNRDIGPRTRRAFQFGYLNLLYSIYTCVSLPDDFTCSSLTSLTPATSQLPGNLILRKFGVRNWLTFIVIGWGAVQLGMGFVNVWPWLVFCRFFLGAFEVWQLFPFQQRSSPDKIQASIFSSILFVMTTWYATEPLSYQYL